MAKPKYEIPEDLSTQFPVPEGATVADLTALETQLNADANKLLADGADAESVAKAEWMIAAIDTIRVRQDELVSEDAAAKQRLDDLRAKLAPPAEPEAAPAEGLENETPEEKAERERKEAEAAAAAGGGQQVDPANVPEPVLVASAGSMKRRSIISQARQGQGEQNFNLPPAKAREAFLTAAADVAGFVAGQTITMKEFGSAASRRFESLPAGVRGGARSQLRIGQVNVPSDDALVASLRSGRNKGGEFIEIDEAIEWALSSERLRQETGEDSLVAAGGWCSPSETLYDLINLTTQDGLLDVPGITVSRGGVRYTLGPDFTAVYNDGANFTRTEAQTIAALAKPIVNIPCPTFTDNRMVVDGLYLTGDILSAKGYPEAYADFTEKSLTAFAHYVNAQSIADQVTLCGSAIDLTQAVSSPTFFQNPAITTELLGAVELAVLDMQYKNRLSLTNAVELVFPIWLKGALRSDYAKRQGVEDAAKISDADLAEFFTLRGARVQWVYDWQDAFTGVSGGFGGATPVNGWPASAFFMIYPQGGFVRALSDVIELNAVYDSVLLTTNQYVALFMEQARLTLKRAWDVRLYKVPIFVTGATGATFDYTTKQPTV